MDQNLDNEYLETIKDYLSNGYVQTLKNIPHHNSNRLEHSLNVSYKSYKVCKKMHLDYKSAAIAGLLHDFYFNTILECDKVKDKVKLFMNEHPEDALKNAEELFELNELEKDIILSHMWPTSKHIPKHKESFVVSFVDKFYSAKEFGKKWSYNISFISGVYFIFFMYNIFE